MSSSSIFGLYIWNCLPVIGSVTALFNQRRTNKDEEKEQDADLEKADQEDRYVLKRLG